MMWFRAYCLYHAPAEIIPLSLAGTSVYMRKIVDGTNVSYSVFDGTDIVLRLSEAEATAYMRTYRTEAGKISVPAMAEQLQVTTIFAKAQRQGFRTPTATREKKRRRRAY